MRQPDRQKGTWDLFKTRLWSYGLPSDTWCMKPRLCTHRLAVAPNPGSFKLWATLDPRTNLDQSRTQGASGKFWVVSVLAAFENELCLHIKSCRKGISSPLFGVVYHQILVGNSESFQTTQTGRCVLKPRSDVSMGAELCSNYKKRIIKYFMWR